MVSNWIDQFKDNLLKTDRYKTMFLALQLLNERKGKVILETGCVRMKDDWGAGMSTYVFGSYCNEFGAHLYSVDISLENIELCKEVTKEFSSHVTLTPMDSLSYILTFDKPIGLLYLDSMDCPINDLDGSPDLLKSQNHQKTEAEYGILRLSSDGLILLDDNDFANGGKTKLTKEFLKDKGFRELLSGKQSLWSK